MRAGLESVDCRRMTLEDGDEFVFWGYRGVINCTHRWRIKRSCSSFYTRSSRGVLLDTVDLQHSGVGGAERSILAGTRRESSKVEVRAFRLPWVSLLWRDIRREGVAV